MHRRQDHGPGAIPRPRLTALLDRAVESRITLIEAAAGYGKSTLLEDWAERATFPVIRHTCRETDNVPASLARRLLHAASTLGIGPIEPADQPTDALLRFVELLRRVPGKVVLMFDDIHILSNVASSELIGMLIDEAPAQVRFLLSGRHAPQFRASRLSLRRDVTVISQQDLMFSDGETADFLDAHGLDPRSAGAMTVASKANGWAAGLELLIRTVKREHGTVDRAELGNAETFDHYVEEEILAPLDSSTRTAILLSSYLPYVSLPLWERMFPEMAAAVAIRTLSDDLALLSNPHQDEMESTYALHQLLTASLERIARRTISESERAPVVSAAVEWFIEMGDDEQALDVALRGARWDQATVLMESIGAGLAIRDESRTILHWLKRFPRPVLLRNDTFAYWMIFASFCVGEAEIANGFLADVESRWLESSSALVRAWLHACRGMRASFTGDTELVVKECKSGLALLPDTCYVERLHAITGLIDGAVTEGRLDDVAELLDQAAEIRRHLPAQQVWWDVHIDLLWPDALALAGRLDEAASIYRHKLETLHRGVARHRGKILFRLASLALEQHRLDDALALTDDIVVERPEVFEAIYWYPEAWIVRARILYAAGRRDEAQELLAFAISYSKDHAQYRAWHVATTVLSMWQAPHANLGLASAPPPRRTIDAVILSKNFGEIDVVFATVCEFIKEKRYQEAFTALKLIQERAQSLGRVDVEVRARAFRAAVYIKAQGPSGMRTAAAILQRAVEVASEGRFIQSFLDPEEDLRPALDRVRVAPQRALYLAALRAAMDEAFGRTDDLVDSISPRERDVLLLLATGSANQVIADELFISLNTVKRHMVRINRKLGTSNRMEAVLRARHLGIL